jgi:hypothetical protein
MIFHASVPSAPSTLCMEARGYKKGRKPGMHRETGRDSR